MKKSQRKSTVTCTNNRKQHEHATSACSKKGKAVPTTRGRPGADTSVDDEKQQPAITSPHQRTDVPKLVSTVQDHVLSPSEQLARSRMESLHGYIMLSIERCIQARDAASKEVATAEFISHTNTMLLFIKQRDSQRFLLKLLSKFRDSVTAWHPTESIPGSRTNGANLIKRYQEILGDSTGFTRQIEMHTEKLSPELAMKGVDLLNRALYEQQIQEGKARQKIGGAYDPNIYLKNIRAASRDIFPGKRALADKEKEPKHTPCLHPKDKKDELRPNPSRAPGPTHAGGGAQTNPRSSGIREVDKGQKKKAPGEQTTSRISSKKTYKK